MFHVKTRTNTAHHFKHASITQTHTYVQYICILCQTWTCSVTHTRTLNPWVDHLFIPSQSTWAVAWPANHNICHVAVTTGLTLHSAQSVHIELTDISCSEGMSTQECTNQSYFTSSTREVTRCHRPSSSLLQFILPFLLSLEHAVQETLNESDMLFTWAIMSRFWSRGTTIF